MARSGAAEVLWRDQGRPDVPRELALQVSAVLPERARSGCEGGGGGRAAQQPREEGGKGGSLSFFSSPSRLLSLQ
eukprot:2513393-Rhodomonas_salina.1